MNESLLEIAIKMAQELQDLVGDAQKCGSDLPATRALLDEWEDEFKKHDPLSSHDQIEIVNDFTDMPASLMKQAS